MDRFIHNENLKLWRRHLAETTDIQERAVLLNLISEEERCEVDRGERTAKASDRNSGGS
jgi:hypothetical protein